MESKGIAKSSQSELADEHPPRLSNLKGVNQRHGWRSQLDGQRNCPFRLCGAKPQRRYMYRSRSRNSVAETASLTNPAASLGATPKISPGECFVPQKKLSETFPSNFTSGTKLSWLEEQVVVRIIPKARRMTRGKHALRTLASIKFPTGSTDLRLNSIQLHLLALGSLVCLQSRLHSSEIIRHTVRVILAEQLQVRTHRRVIEYPVSGRREIAHRNLSGCKLRGNQYDSQR